ncbi:MAG TPA: hypothetical protein VNK46_06920 [Nitrospiraceae bacterium]|nr:hypothetical protein [Nitrospiraceae bacterium]
MSNHDSRLTALQELLRKWDCEEETITVVVQLIHHFGLLHEPTRQAGTTARIIRQQAKMAEQTQGRKVLHALVRHVPPDALAKRTAAARQVARLRVEAEQYQTQRGDRIIPRFPTPQDRQRTASGRRPEIEVTYFLQILDRYLAEEEAMEDVTSRLRCLASLLCRIEGNLRPSKLELRKMENRVRDRLRKAPPLDDFDYHWALGQAPKGWEYAPLVIRPEIKSLPEQE